MKGLFSRVLIANRGEIAVRIIRACRDCGISPIVVYSEPDRESLAVRLADRALYIGPAAAAESYLNLDRILEAAREAQADALHPGYGFLAENAALAEACHKRGIVFIGPSAHSMRLMGDKISSRQTAVAAGVPVVPGSDGAVDSRAEAARIAEEIGYPIMLKASAGGGGKGMRLVRSPEVLAEVYETTRSEALAAFGDGSVFLERYIECPRHIEIQILADGEGNVIHLGERECSIQRRHQKLIEESPSPFVSPDFRAQLGEAAVRVARAANYQNAGTVEFLVDGASDPSNPNFFFLEMNTRLQVEHPVTEAVTGLDLVQEQFQIAAGRALRWAQHDIEFRGAAIEVRVYAEDANQNFMPSPGRVSTLIEPSGPGIRNDSGVVEGSEVSIYYDPLISKLISHGRNREEARQRLSRALREYRIGGLHTTIPFFRRVLEHPAFCKGDLSTHFIQDHSLAQACDRVSEESFLAASLVYYLDHPTSQPRPEPRQSAWRDYFRVQRSRP